jgi:yeast amino acid transporter
LDHVINALALVFVLSAANTDLYIASRTLYGLALEEKAPAIFILVNRFGVPYTALGVSVLVACFAFLSIGQGSGKALEYLSNLCSTFGALTWSEFSSTPLSNIKVEY